MICVHHIQRELKIICELDGLSNLCKVEYNNSFHAANCFTGLFLLPVLYRYGSPILDIKWHHTLNTERQKLITTDSHIVRIWDPETVRFTMHYANTIVRCTFSHLTVLQIVHTQKPSLILSLFPLIAI